MANNCGLTASEANRALLRYMFEDNDCWGVTQSSGETHEIRLTGSSLAATKDTTVSNELRADRMVSDIVETGASSGGDIEWEFSAGSQDDFFQAFVLGRWTRPMTFFDVSGDKLSVTSATTVTISGEDVSPLFVSGRRIKMSGFVDPANNVYKTISTIVYAAGVTTITFTTGGLVAEAGTAYSSLSDANDVIILNDTTLRFGTGGASTIDSNGNNAFASAIAAGQLPVGMKIFVQGAGYDVGSVQFTAAGSDGDTITVSDGVSTVVFSLDNDSAYTKGTVPVTIGADADATASNFSVALNEQRARGNLRVKAVVSTDTVTITNLEQDMSGNGSIDGGTAPVTITAFTGGDDSLNGVFTVINTTDDVLTVSPQPNTDANGAGLPIVIKGSHLRNPGSVSQITRQSMTIETGFTDVGQYFVQNGMRVGSFSMSIAAGEIVNGTFTFNGKETTALQATKLGDTATYTVLPTNGTDVMNATTNVAQLYKNGAVLSSGVASIDISGESNLRNQSVVASKFPGGVGVGRFNLTGKITTYFETLDLFNDFLNHRTISLGWDFKDNDGNYYFFTIPSAVITSDPLAPPGVDEDVMEEMDWVAKRDTNLNTMFMIDRFSSVDFTSA